MRVLCINGPEGSGNHEAAAVAEAHIRGSIVAPPCAPDCISGMSRRQHVTREIDRVVSAQHGMPSNGETTLIFPDTRFSWEYEAAKGLVGTRNVLILRLRTPVASWGNTGEYYRPSNGWRDWSVKWGGRDTQDLVLQVVQAMSMWAREMRELV